MKKELKSLKRGELIEIIYQLKKNEQELQNEISLLNIQLENKNLQFENVGSVAEAAISIADVFNAAQKAADIYLEEVKNRKENIDHECEMIRSEAQAEAEAIIGEAEKEAEEILRDAMQQKEIILEQCRKSRNELKRFRAIIQSLDGETTFDVE